MSNTIIVTPNGNVAMHLKRCEQSKEYHPNESHWIPRPVYTLDEWIDDLATPLLEEVYPKHTLLKPIQEKALWREIISSWNQRHDQLNATDKHDIPLLGLANTIRQAATCWKSLRQYHALETPYIEGLKQLKLGRNLWNGRAHTNTQDPTNTQEPANDREHTPEQASANIYSEFYLRQLNDSTFDDASDARNSSEFNNFVTWQRQFQEQCQKNRWIDSAVLPTLVAANLANPKYADRLRHAGKLPDKIVAYGFMEAPEEVTPATDVCSCTLTPQRTELLKAFLNCGCQVVMAADMNATELYPGLDKLECQFTCQMTPKPEKKDNKKEQEAPSEPTSSATPANKQVEPISVYETTDDEFRAIAQQVLHAVLPTEKGGLGLTNVGVIVPGLEERREVIMQAFDEALCPQRLLLTHSNEPRPYTVSLGQSLDQVPIVSTALRFLRSLSERLPLTTLTDTLFSPYFGEGNDNSRLISSANFNTKLRKRRQHGYTLPELLQAKVGDSEKDQETQKYIDFEKAATEYLPEGLHKRVLDVQNRLEASADTRDFTTWGQVFLDILTAMKWGANTELTADDLRAKRRLLDLLESWTELNHVSSQSVNLGQAVRFLTEQTKDVIFQVKAAYKAPVHISGILEAVGLRFQRVFVVNYTDQSWPSLGAPMPYLPMELQKALHMPVGEEQLRQANWVSARLASLSPDGVLSFANTFVVDRMPCTLNLSHLHDKLHVRFETVSAEQLQEIHEHSASFFTRLMLKTFTDSPADQSPQDTAAQTDTPSKTNAYLELHVNPRVLPLQAERLKGGSYTLNDQLSCPFKALVKGRWSGEEMDESDESLNSLDLGNLYHKVMEKLWDTWKSSTTLEQREQEERQADIHQAVDEVVNTLQEAHPHYGADYFVLAKERAYRMVDMWFDTSRKLEKNHAMLGDYSVTCEDAVALRLPLEEESEAAAYPDKPGFTINMRLDRLDTLQTDPAEGDDSKNTRVFIGDYKTSKYYTPSKWYNIKKSKEPPKDIQLPLYALHYAKNKGAESILGMGYDILNAKELDKINTKEKDLVNTLAVLRKETGEVGVRSSYKIEPKETIRTAYIPKQEQQATKQKSTTPKVASKRTVAKDNDSSKNTENDGSLLWNEALNFDDLLAYWKNWANTLAQEILQGQHPPTPSKNACKYCKFAPLCRHNFTDSYPISTPAANAKKGEA